MTSTRALTWMSLVAASAMLCQCAKAPGTAHQGAAPITSFAAAVHEHGRSPLDLSLASGRAVYDRYCAICHGDTGGGDGFNAYPLKDAFGVNPTAFSDRAQAAALKETESIAAIRNGGLAVGKSAAMPAWGYTLTPGEVADVWQYIRSFATTGHGK
jgi:cytochrome c oxidase cbb3-type subunit 3